MSPEKIAERNRRAGEWKRMYVEEGFCLQEIGDKYHVTRERVRQVLKKVCGIGYKDSGRRKLILADREKYNEESASGRLIAKAKKYGMSIEETAQWRDMYRNEVDSGMMYADTLERRYMDFRGNARRHGGTDVTRMDWYALWAASGHYHEFGRGRWCIGRKDRTKGFTKDNVLIWNWSEHARAKRVFKSDEAKRRWRSSCGK